MFFWKNEEIYKQFKEIGERYRKHFGEDFPVYLIIPFEVTEEVLLNYNSVVDSCIKKNEAFEKRNLSAFFVLRKEELMFIWEWVLIALGWLVFLMVVAFCLSLTRSLIEEFSNRK